MEKMPGGFWKGDVAMTYSALDVAKYTVNYCTRKSQPVSNLKLQKMLYFMWIDYYKSTGEELFADDICAWRLGPVVPDVYYEYCSYAGRPISLQLESNIENCDEERLSHIINCYLPIPASVLVDKTHAKDKPWDIVYQDGIGNRDVIPFALIKRLEC